MSALLPQPDPKGLLEYSVVYTDRALNHMSQRFQGVMKDISRILKTVYNAKSAVVVPGSGTFGMEAVARQFATDRKCLVIRNQALVQLPLDADFRNGPHSFREHRAQGASDPPVTLRRPLPLHRLKTLWLQYGNTNPTWFSPRTSKPLPA